GLVVGQVQLRDPLGEALVLELPGGALTGRSLVISGRRHAQDAADRLDPEALAICIDERAHFGRCGSSSLAKNTDASFRIEFARRSSNTSRRNRRISSRSSVVSPSRMPASTSARRTRLRNASGWIPRSRAIYAIGRSPSSARRIPRSINSFGYFLGRAMGPTVLLDLALDLLWLGGAGHCLAGCARLLAHFTSSFTLSVACSGT